VVVGALVRAADDHGDELAVFPDLAVSHGRLQELPVLFEEGAKVEGSQGSLGGHAQGLSASPGCCSMAPGLEQKPIDGSIEFY